MMATIVEDQTYNTSNIFLAKINTTSPVGISSKLVSFYKCCENNNKDEDNSLKTLNDKNFDSCSEVALDPPPIHNKLLHDIALGGW